MIEIINEYKENIATTIQYETSIEAILSILRQEKQSIQTKEYDDFNNYKSEQIIPKVKRLQSANKDDELLELIVDLQNKENDIIAIVKNKTIESNFLFNELSFFLFGDIKGVLFSDSPQYWYIKFDEIRKFLNLLDLHQHRVLFLQWCLKKIKYSLDGVEQQNIITLINSLATENQIDLLYAESTEKALPQQPKLQWNGNKTDLAVFIKCLSDVGVFEPTRRGDKLSPQWSVWEKLTGITELSKAHSNAVNRKTEKGKLAEFKQCIESICDELNIIKEQFKNQ